MISPVSHVIHSNPFVTLDGELEVSFSILSMNWLMYVLKIAWWADPATTEAEYKPKTCLRREK